MLIKASWFYPNEDILCTEDNLDKDILSAFLFCCYPKYRESNEISRHIIRQEFRNVFDEDININSLSRQFEINIYILERLDNDSIITAKAESSIFNVGIIICRENSNFLPVTIRKKDSIKQSMLFLQYDTHSFYSLQEFNMNMIAEKQHVNFKEWYKDLKI
mgnify:CR=1 FL=1|tara:strand:+ start:993 stop:1475 length:483 start_codon:yes stop_codon:yes gene_type:complete